MGQGGHNTGPRAPDRKRPPQGSLESSAPKRPKSHNVGATTAPKVVPIHRKHQPAKVSNDSSTPGNGRSGARLNVRDVRAIAVSKPDPAVQDGQLNVQAFVDARSFELKALTESMRRTKASSTSRAFQIVPITLRRRTAAHNHKRVPKRLRPRAKREMVQDNTPTVNSKTRKPGSTRSRLRAENANRLSLLARRKKMLKLKKPGLDKKTISLRAARPKIRRNTLNNPKVTNRKFRRRQINKTWLPTHLWHTKRSRMTEPTKPLWRFAIPLTPSNKSYRPTHRAQFERGALAWDMSYMSTIGLAGRFSSVCNVLKSLGLDQDNLWDGKGARWRSGAAHWSGLLRKLSKDSKRVLGPATVIWNPVVEAGEEDVTKQQRRLFIRLHPSAFLETFNELLRLVRMNNPRPYVEDLRYEIGTIDIVGPCSTEALMAILRPHPRSAEGSEQCHAVKFQSLNGLKDPAALPMGSLFAFPASDPRLSYPFPPRPSTSTSQPTDQERMKLYEMLSNFHKQPAGPPIPLFDRDARFQASKLPSQKSLSRRKSKGAPGAALNVTTADPPIPLLVLATRHPTDPQAPGSWTVMMPWKCVLPFWYCLMHYPLSTGGNPQFGGLDELRQLAFERSLPWFPGDVPGTASGNAWELEQRELRLKKWQRMPKGKRHNFETLKLGGGRKGELGDGWSCAYELLFRGTETEITKSQDSQVDSEDVCMNGAGQAVVDKPATIAGSDSLADIVHLPKTSFNHLLQRSPAVPIPPKTLVTVKIRMITKGTPLACARIYRLPTVPHTFSGSQDESSMDIDAPQQTIADIPASIPNAQQQQQQQQQEQSAQKSLPTVLYEQWLALLPNSSRNKHSRGNATSSNSHQQDKKKNKRNLTVEDRQRLIMQQLTAPVPPVPASTSTSKSSALPQVASAFVKTNLAADPFFSNPASVTLLNSGHPVCPDEHDLIGFVTKGEFNLRDGRGEGIGNLSAVLAAEELRRYSSSPSSTGVKKKNSKAKKAGGANGARGSVDDGDSRHDAAVRLCVVRNAGEDVGRLARWELVGL